VKRSFEERSGVRRAGGLVVCLALAACGSDAAAPTETDLVGQWDYVISGATGVGVTGVCSIADITLTFTQNGDVLAGTATAAGPDNVVCVSASTTTRTVEGTATLRNVVVNGASIEFEFGELSSPAVSSTVPIISTGSVTGGGNTMSGTVTFAMRFASAGGAVTRAFTGDWTATRR